MRDEMCANAQKRDAKEACKRDQTSVTLFFLMRRNIASW